MEQYVGDFAIERKAREKAVEKVSELRKQIENLEKDKKELRGQLNQHAASQCQVDFAQVRANCHVGVQDMHFLLQDPEYSNGDGGYQHANQHARPYQH